MAEEDKKTLSRRNLLFGGIDRIKRNLGEVMPATTARDPDIEAGDAALAARDYQAALDSYRSVLAKTPKNPTARGRLGYCLMRQGDLPGAIRELRRATELRHKDHFALLYLGLSLAKSGDLPGAVDVWREYFNPSQLTLQREINIQTALMQTSDPPTAEEVVRAVEEAIEEQRRIILGKD